MQIYAAALHGAFETITDNPDLGHRRPDLSERHRAFQVEHHFVVYTVYDQTMNVSASSMKRWTLHGTSGTERAAACNTLDETVANCFPGPPNSSPSLPPAYHIASPHRSVPRR